MTKHERAQRFAELYSAGKTLAEIGKEVGCSYETVRVWLGRLGVKFRRRGPRNVNVPQA